MEKNSKKSTFKKVDLLSRNQRKSHLIIRFSLLLILCFIACQKDEVKRKLSIDVSPYGSGFVDLTPNGKDYPDGTNVLLDPKPAAGYKFISWEGVDTSFLKNNTITMSKDMTLIAKFISINKTVACKGSCTSINWWIEGEEGFVISKDFEIKTFYTYSEHGRTAVTTETGTITYSNGNSYKYTLTIDVYSCKYKIRVDGVGICGN